MNSIPQHRFFVYVLARPNGKPFYVGKGSGDRVFAHDTEARSGHRCHKCNIIRKIWKNGGVVQRYIVFTTDDEHEAMAYEVETIALYGRANLANLTDGGEGPSGLVHTPETRSVLSEKSKAAWTNPDIRAKIVASQVVAKSTPEARARNSASLKAYYADPEARAKQLAQLREVQSRSDVRAKLAAAGKQGWTDPEKRANLQATLKSVWASPGYREKMRAARKAAFDRRKAEQKKDM